MKSRIKQLFFIFILLALLPSAFAHGNDVFDEAREIIEQEIPCSELSEEQLEYIGDFFMEQMHPGEEHERMDAMMGGEGSLRLKAIHISMANRFYCQDNDLPATHFMESWGIVQLGILSVFALVLGLIIVLMIKKKN